MVAVRGSVNDASLSCGNGQAVNHINDELEMIWKALIPYWVGNDILRGKAR